MTTHQIPLESILPKGKVTINTSNDELCMTAITAINTEYVYQDTPIKSFACIPGKFKLPFRIDMTIKIDSPSLYLIIGKGHISFNKGMDNRSVTDILGNDYKPNTHEFNNFIPINKYVDISVTYGCKAMWIIVNNECRCFSKNDPYIKALKTNSLAEEWKDGFELGIACDKRTQLTLKSINITEYENEEPVAPTGNITIKTPQVCLTLSEKPAVDECIHGLAPDLQKEILRTDEYLLNDMKKCLKFKRKIEGGYPNSRITYVSPLGISYKIFITDFLLSHDMGWVDYNTKREQEKYGGTKKADYTIETLNKLAETSLEFSNDMFFRMKECVNCSGNGSCIHIKSYKYDGKTKLSCGGRIHLKMFPSDFNDLRKMVCAINSVILSL
jgi:hypothetical protein